MVVLDACVLVPSVLADTLLRYAEHDLYRPKWSASILDEVRRNLPGSIDEAGVERRIAAMRSHFAEAEVVGYEPLIDQMSNHPKDRHVLAAAVAAGAERVVTTNLRDFPQAALRPHAIEAQHPDDFLCDLFESSPDQAVEIITQQAEATGRRGHPKLTVDDILTGFDGLSGSPVRPSC